MSTTDYSRTLLLAGNNAAEQGEALEDRIKRCQVVVTADVDAPTLEPTIRVLVANLRRLPVDLHLNPAAGIGMLPQSLVDDLITVCAGIDPDRPITIGVPAGDAVWVHVGTSDLPALARGVADGHGTRIRPAREPFPPLAAPGTGLGAVLTAASLTAEAFKAIVGVRPERHAPTRGIDFCPVSLGDPTPGPTRALAPLTDAALIGGGAIGTAIALIMRELGATGELTVVDPETFDKPNVTTYSLGSQTEANDEIRKVDLIANACPDLNVRPFEGTARDYMQSIESGALPMPRLVLGAVDSVEARHEIAALHADRVLDGSTGGDTGTTLSLSEARWDGPCLRCYYRERSDAGPSVEQQIVERTGLPLELLANGDHVLTDAHVIVAAGRDPELAALMRHQVGKPICGLGKALGLTGTDEGFNPSAAFVAQQAAALVIGALIRNDADSTLHVQYDTLFGPYDDMCLTRAAQPACRCIADQDIHMAVRAKRAGATSG